MQARSEIRDACYGVDVFPPGCSSAAEKTLIVGFMFNSF